MRLSTKALAVLLHATLLALPSAAQDEQCSVQGTCSATSAGSTPDADSPAQVPASVADAGDTAAVGQGLQRTPAFLRPLWPVTPSKIPTYVFIVVCVWIFVGSSLRGTRTEQDELFEDRRVRQIMDQLAQIVYEHWKVEVELHKYEARDMQLQELARERRSDKGAGTATDIRSTPEYQEIIVETGFADTYGPDNPMPVRLEPQRVLEALVDEIDQCPVSMVKAVLRRLNVAELNTFALLFREAYCIMLSRTNAKLQEIICKTKEARAKHAGNAAYSSLTTGSRLVEILDTAKDLHKCFYRRRFFRLLPPAGIDGFGAVEEDAQTRDRRTRTKEAVGDLPPRKDLEAEFFTKLKTAKALMKEIDQVKGGLLKRVLSYCERTTLVNVALLVCTRFVYAVVGPIHQSLVAGIVNNVSGDDWSKNAFNGCLGWMAIFCMDWWVCDFISIVCTAKATGSITRKLRNELFQAIMRQDTVFFETHETGWIQDRLKRDCDELSEKVLMFPVRMIDDSLHIIAKSAFLYYYCPRMTYNALGMGFVGAVPMIIMQNYVQQLVRRSDRFIARTNAKTDELLNNLSTVREFAREPQETGNFEHAEKNKSETSLYIHAMRHVQWPIIITILACGYLMNVYEGARRINVGEMKPTDVIMVVGETWCIIWHCRSIVEKFPQVMELLLPAERVFRLLEQQSAVEPMPGDERVPFRTSRGDGEYNGGIEIEFDDVSFAYPTMPEHAVLRGMTLRIPAGKTVSLVGERGCGKSTTLELLQRKYNVEPDSGVLRVNGRPIAEWDLRQYRRRLSIVAQGPKVFTNTIRENILYGLSDEERRERGFDGPEAATRGFMQLKRICDLACCWDFIKDFPLQLETRIGTKGIKLSGGQTQCLTIARALIKNPACLILDEATAALDNETQKKVAENISALQREQGFTIVQIAHRLTTLTNSDIIYFISHGVVMEAGGLETQDGTAVQELNRVQIKRNTVVNPETHEPEQRVVQGFFRQLWNVANDVKSLEELSLKKLLEKARELRDDLGMAEAEIQKKAADQLPRLLRLDRAVTTPFGDKISSRRLTELSEKNQAEESNAHDGMVFAPVKIDRSVPHAAPVATVAGADVDAPPLAPLVLARAFSS